MDKKYLCSACGEVLLEYKDWKYIYHSPFEAEGNEIKLKCKCGENTILGSFEIASGKYRCPN